MSDRDAAPRLASATATAGRRTVLLLGLVVAAAVVLAVGYCRDQASE